MKKCLSVRVRTQTGAIIAIFLDLPIIFNMITCS